MCRTKEEILRINVKIQCLATYIRDEDHYLRACEAQMQLLYLETLPPFFKDGLKLHCIALQPHSPTQLLPLLTRQSKIQVLFSLRRSNPSQESHKAAFLHS